MLVISVYGADELFSLRRTGAQQRPERDNDLLSVKRWDAWYFNQSVLIKAFSQSKSENCTTLKEDDVWFSADRSRMCALRPPGQRKRLLHISNGKKTKTPNRARWKFGREKGEIVWESPLLVRTWAGEEQEQSWDGEEPHGPLPDAPGSRMRHGPSPGLRRTDAGTEQPAAGHGEPRTSRDASPLLSTASDAHTRRCTTVMCGPTWPESHCLCCTLLLFLL